MFRFVYSLLPDERLDPASLRVDEFDAFESADATDHGVAAIGRRAKNLPDALTTLRAGSSWAVCKPDLAWRQVANLINEAEISGELLVEPFADCVTVRELWVFHESIIKKNVKLAYPIHWGRATGVPPSAVIPVLNLRIGLVRVNDAGAETIEIVKRLAGIGYEGMFVVDPPATPDRVGEARKIVEIVRDIIEPRKPMKTVAKKSV